MIKASYPCLMDAIDEKILEMLKEDARMPNVHIGRRIGLTEGAVRNRIRNLVKAGVIKRFTVETRSAGLEALVLIQAVPALTRAVVHRMKRITREVFETSGEYDIAAMLHTKDMEDLNSLVDLVRSIKGVQRTLTLVKMAQD